MKWPLACLLVALVAVGCRNSPQATDPFLRTTVPPPGTNPGGPDPYYPPPGAPPAQFGPPSVTPGVPAPPGFQPQRPVPLNLQQSMLEPPDSEPDDGITSKSPDSAIAAADSQPADALTQVEVTSPRAQFAAIEPEQFVQESSPAEEPTSTTQQSPSDVRLLSAVSPDVADQVAAPSASRVSLRDSALDETYVNVSDQQDAVAGDDGPAAAEGSTTIRILSPRESMTFAARNSDIGEMAASDAAPVARIITTIGPKPFHQSAAPPTELAAADTEVFSAPASAAEVTLTSHREPVESVVMTTPPPGVIINPYVNAPAATPAAYTAPVATTPAPPAAFRELPSSASSDNAPKYAHGDGYEWLHGKLEYLQSSKQWKLRYIPIDGRTDGYGGSVLLPASPALDSFKPGEFARVEGIVGPRDPLSRGFSPVYQVQQIAPLR